MATPSLTQHYTIKEFQLLLKDSPVVPAEIQPFVGVGSHPLRPFHSLLTLGPNVSHFRRRETVWERCTVPRTPT